MMDTQCKYMAFFLKKLLLKLLCFGHSINKNKFQADILQKCCEHFFSETFHRKAHVTFLCNPNDFLPRSSTNKSRAVNVTMHLCLHWGFVVCTTNSQNVCIQPHDSNCENHSKSVENRFFHMYNMR